MGLRNNVAESLEMRSGSVTRSFLFILGTFFLYAGSGGFTALPGAVSLVFGVVFIVFWLGFPVALYFDRKYVAGNSEWTPSKWYYLGVLPGYLGLAFIAFYIYKRKQHFE